MVSADSNDFSVTFTDSFNLKIDIDCDCNVITVTQFPTDEVYTMQFNDDLVDGEEVSTLTLTTVFEETKPGCADFKIEPSTDAWVSFDKTNAPTITVSITASADDYNTELSEAKKSYSVIAFDDANSIS